MVRNKRIAYDYLFNYFGGDKWDGKIVGGSDITLNIRPYKDGKEVLFKDNEELTAANCSLSDVFTVSFDRENQFVIKKDLTADSLFRIAFGWERIEASIIKYELDVYVGKVGDEQNELPKSLQDIPIMDPVVVTEKEYRDFLASHADDFDITDNKHAQVPSVLFYDVPDNK